MICRAVFRSIIFSASSFGSSVASWATSAIDCLRTRIDARFATTFAYCDCRWLTEVAWIFSLLVFSTRSPSAWTTAKRRVYVSLSRRGKRRGRLRSTANGTWSEQIVYREKTTKKYNEMRKIARRWHCFWGLTEVFTRYLVQKFSYQVMVMIPPIIQNRSQSCRESGHVIYRCNHVNQLRANKRKNTAWSHKRQEIRTDRKQEAKQVYWARSRWVVDCPCYMDVREEKDKDDKTAGGTST